MALKPLLGAALSVLLASAAIADDNGSAAFARHDYEAAAALWRAEAAAGSAEAKFGLGLIADLGLGAPRDSAVALRWYLEAAGDGVPDAAFNVAVMLDAGTGTARDPAAAALWYARAALSGHPRAQYNLGQLYAAGVGVPQNADLAAFWFTAAAPKLAAARNRLKALAPVDPADRVADAPVPIAGAIVPDDAGGHADLIWTAPPGPAKTTFQIELADPAGRIVATRRFSGSALRVVLPAATQLRWRVGRVALDGSAAAFSPWNDLTGPAGVQPDPHVTIYVNADDGRARAFADELRAGLGAGGVSATVATAAVPVAETEVVYGREADHDLAAEVAELLPALHGTDAVMRDDPAGPRGEIAVRLVGGPETGG